MSEIVKKWYVLRAVSGKEAKVKEYLDADLKHNELSEFVSQVLIPTEKYVQVRNGKKIVKERRRWSSHSIPQQIPSSVLLAYYGLYW